MSKKRRKNDYLPFMEFRERPTRDFGEIPEDCRLHLREEYVRDYMNPLSGIRTKGYDVAIDYTFSKGKVETNRSHEIFGDFEEKLLDLLSPIMDYCESVHVEVVKK